MDKQLERFSIKTIEVLVLTTDDIIQQYCYLSIGTITLFHLKVDAFLACKDVELVILKHQNQSKIIKEVIEQRNKL